jgi:hypothetical protein
VPNRRSASDYDNDMKLAKAAGIDAFALNIGTDSYTETQLRFAYESAVNNGMKVFIFSISTGIPLPVLQPLLETSSRPSPTALLNSKSTTKSSCPRS